MLFEPIPQLLIATLFVLGACIGSFLNVVILRLPGRLFWQWKIQCREMLTETPSEQRQSNVNDHLTPPPGLIQPGSRCPNCHHSLTLFQNIPIIGYLLLAGKCGFCREKISIRYLLVELFSALLWVQLGLHFGLSLALIFALILTSCFIVLALIDLDHQILPDIIVIPLIWIGLIANGFQLFTELQSAVFGAITGYLALWTIYQIHHRLTGKEGMGYGDFKLLACIGAWLGWQVLPMVILLASLSGTLVTVLLIIFRQQGKENPIAFGPYLAASGYIILIWGDRIMNHYQSLLKL